MNRHNTLEPAPPLAPDLPLVPAPGEARPGQQAPMPPREGDPVAVPGRGEPGRPGQGNPGRNFPGTPNPGNAGH